MQLFSLKLPRFFSYVVVIFSIVLPFLGTQFSSAHPFFTVSLPPFSKNLQVLYFVQYQPQESCHAEMDVFIKGNAENVLINQVVCGLPVEEQTAVRESLENLLIQSQKI